MYRLVADGNLPNIQTHYRRLSNVTAEARRAKSFPDLLDRTSRIERYQSFDGPDAAREYIRDVYRRDRSEGQDWSIYLGVEKAGMSEQLAAWFTNPFGIPHVALGGCGATSSSRTAAAFLRRYGRLVQYEVDALPPEVLRDLYRTAIEGYWDPDTHQAVMEQEAEEREALR